MDERNVGLLDCYFYSLATQVMPVGLALADARGWASTSRHFRRRPCDTIREHESYPLQSVPYGHGCRMRSTARGYGTTRKNLSQHQRLQSWEEDQPVGWLLGHVPPQSGWRRPCTPQQALGDAPCESRRTTGSDGQVVCCRKVFPTSQCQPKWVDCLLYTSDAADE